MSTHVTVTYKCPNCPAAFAVVPAPFPCATLCECGEVATYVDGTTEGGHFHPYDNANNRPQCDACMQRTVGHDCWNHYDVCDGCTRCHREDCVCVYCDRCNVECTSEHVTVDGEPYCATCAPLAVRHALQWPVRGVNNKA